MAIAAGVGQNLQQVIVTAVGGKEKNKQTGHELRDSKGRLEAVNVSQLL